MRLPTALGKHVLENVFRARMQAPSEAVQLVATFQRMCLVSDLQAAIESVKPFLKPEHRTFASGSPDMVGMELIASTVKSDVLGLAVDSLLGIANSTVTSAKDRISAAAILQELYGEKQIIKEASLTDKLVIDLVGRA